MHMLRKASRVLLDVRDAASQGCVTSLSLSHVQHAEGGIALPVTPLTASSFIRSPVSPVAVPLGARLPNDDTTWDKEDRKWEAR